MQKYLEYLSFLRWPRGFLTSWQLENSIFFPQNSRLEHEQSLGWGWKLILNRQILVFLPYRADPNFPHHQGKFRLFKLRKEGEKSPKNLHSLPVSFLEYPNSNITTNTEPIF